MHTCDTVEMGMVLHGFGKLKPVPVPVTHYHGFTHTHVMPYIFKLSDLTATNPHLEKTQELLSIYSPQSSQDILVNKAQFALVSNPLPQTIWQKILLDLFVDFEKLFASMDKAYNHHNDPKDFRAGYVLIKKDQAFSKWSLRMEADWIQVFGAWSTGIIVEYI
jgi:hypothetical protein